MISTTFHIDSRERTVSFVDRRNFVLGETYAPAILSGIVGADLASLAVFFYDPLTFVLLAGAFNVPGSTPITKDVDRYVTEFNFLSPECVALFSNSAPAEKEMVMVVRDQNLVFAKQVVLLSYTNIVSAGPSPELPALSAAIQVHSLDLSAHPGLISKLDVGSVQKFDLSDDSASFSTLCTLFNNLVAALQAPRA
jgi:hypothetical protein